MLRDYATVYKALVQSGEHPEIENEINALMFDSMMELPNSDLLGILKAVNPSSTITAISLDDSDEVDDFFGSASVMTEQLRKTARPLDFECEILVSWDGIYETVDSISDISCDWNEVFDEAIESGIIWDADLDFESDNYRLCDLFRKAEALTFKDCEIFADMDFQDLDDLLHICWKSRNESPACAKLQDILETVIEQKASLID